MSYNGAMRSRDSVTERLNLRLSLELKELLQRMADHEQRDLSAMARVLIKEAIHIRKVAKKIPWYTKELS